MPRRPRFLREGKQIKNSEMLYSKSKFNAMTQPEVESRTQGQGQPFRGKNLSRPRTGTLEAKAKDQGHRRKCSPKKKSSKFFFRRSPIHWRTQKF